jgi:GGDEF domain-containing protein
MMRQTDTVARLGGDEFAIVQSRIDHPLDASALATRLLRELSTPFEVAGHHVVISTSIGIAIAPGDGSRAPISRSIRRRAMVAIGSATSSPKCTR